MVIGSTKRVTIANWLSQDAAFPLFFSRIVLVRSNQSNHKITTSIEPRTVHCGPLKHSSNYPLSFYKDAPLVLVAERSIKSTSLHVP